MSVRSPMPHRGGVCSRSRRGGRAGTSFVGLLQGFVLSVASWKLPVRSMASVCFRHDRLLLSLFLRSFCAFLRCLFDFFVSSRFQAMPVVASAARGRMWSGNLRLCPRTRVAHSRALPSAHSDPSAREHNPTQRGAAFDEFPNILGVRVLSFSSSLFLYVSAGGTSRYIYCCCYSTFLRHLRRV